VTCIQLVAALVYVMLNPCARCLMAIQDVPFAQFKMSVPLFPRSSYASQFTLGGM
jgi:uncharacterized protein YcbX